MNKKAYMKPAMQTMELKHRMTILAVSKDEYGMNKQLRGTSSEPDDEEVDYAW